MLAAVNGHKDVVFILTQKGANLDLVNRVSVSEHIKRKYKSFFSNTTRSCFTFITILEKSVICFYNVFSPVFVPFLIGDHQIYRHHFFIHFSIIS